ncbi:dihydrouridine synthase-domain-containing protein [Cyathus striatus]|nr:dihydrouridine synthase-domain-containing protein [Cyathus striatus]
MARILSESPAAQERKKLSGYEFIRMYWGVRINILHKNLSIPVTTKLRVFPSVEKTVQYAKMLEASGAQILTCHGRLREQRGINTGLADWPHIAAVKKAVKVPVFANGNTLYQADILRCLEETRCDGGLVDASGGLQVGRSGWARIPPHQESMLTQHPPAPLVALEYLDIVRTLRTTTGLSAVKGQLFKHPHQSLRRETDLRERLGRIKISQHTYKEERENGVWNEESGVGQYVVVVKEMAGRMERDMKAAFAEGKQLKDLIVIHSHAGLDVIPHWLLQPYFRALPGPPTEGEYLKKREEKKKRKEEEAARAARKTARTEKDPEVLRDADALVPPPPSAEGGRGIAVESEVMAVDAASVVEAGAVRVEKRALGEDDVKEGRSRRDQGSMRGSYCRRLVEHDVIVLLAYVPFF